MNRRILKLLPLMFGLLPVCFAGQASHAQDKVRTNKPVTKSQRGTDSIRLSDGKNLLGYVIANSNGGEIKFATPVQWLKTRYPKLYEQELESLKSSYARNKEVLLERIRQWREQKIVTDAKDGVIGRVLADEADRLASTKLDLDALRFFTLTLAHDDYTRIEIAKVENRKLGGLAYQFDLQDVESRPAYALRRELEAMGVDIDKESVDLRSMLPKMTNDTGRQWNARQAIYEHNYVKAIEYQGTKASHFRPDTEPTMGVLLSQLTSPANQIAQLGRELGLPEFAAPSRPEKWWQKACSDVAAEGYRGVVFKIIEPGSNQQIATVEVYFFARDDDGQWFQLAKFAAQADASQQSQQEIDELAQQPQVKKIVDMTQSMGLDVSSRLDQALRYGAASREALGKASSQLQLFLGGYLNGLDRPELPKL